MRIFTTAENKMLQNGMILQAASLLTLFHAVKKTGDYYSKDKMGKPKNKLRNEYSQICTENLKKI